MSLIAKRRKKFRRSRSDERAIITACVPKPSYKVWVQFNDGLSGIVDLEYLVGKGVFEAWKDVAFFERVQIDKVTSTLCWENGIEIDPYVIRQSLAVS